MLGIMTRAFAPNMPAWMAKLTQMIPSYGHSLADDATMCYDIRRDTAATLHIVPPKQVGSVKAAI
jgi:malate dehydrogenase (quinone)